MLNSKKSRQALFAASIAVAGLGLAPSSARADTDLVFCNKTGSKIYIAVAYVDAASNKWILSAWLPRNPGECSSSGRVKTGLFYYSRKKKAVKLPGRARTALISISACPPRASSAKWPTAPAQRAREILVSAGA